MERQRVHVMVVENILAQFWIVGVQHALGGAGMDVTLAVMAGVKQQRGAALDAHVAYAQEQGAERLAVSSPLALTRASSGSKSLYQPPLANRSDVSASDEDEMRTNTRTTNARMNGQPY